MVNADVSLNLSYEPVPKKKKGKGRFYGNKNYRNPTRAKYLNKRPRHHYQQNKQSRRVLDTSSFKQKSFRPLTHAEVTSVGNSTSESTALHFNAFDSVTVSKNTKKNNHHVSRKSHKPDGSKETAKNDQQPKAGTNTQSTSKPSVGPWKSSLFNQNPEIPKINQVEVSEVSEKIFSKSKFSDLGLHPHLVSCVSEKLGLTQMTSIQQESVPVLLQQKDALIKSQTGSGKTLAYALPMVQMLQSKNPKISRTDGPVALILTPTRELALQSYEIFASLTKPFCHIVPSWIIGGENRKSEKSRIRKGVNIVVGTPGRVLDHIQTTKNFSLHNLCHLIFDEADRLLDMGFQRQIDMILKELNSATSKQKYQTVLLSATLSEKVECLASVTLNNPVRIQVANATCEDSMQEEAESIFAQPDNLKQHVCVVPSKLRLVCLVTFMKTRLTHNIKTKMVVFLSCRDSVEFHYQLFHRILRHPKADIGLNVPGDFDLADVELEEVQISELHGGMSQTERQTVFHKFSASESGVLLTTDVAARGLDLPSVTWVIQYTCPGSPVDYIHRVGRTARAGKSGNAILMLTPAEVKYVKLLTQYNIKVHEMSVEDILTAGKGVRKRGKYNSALWQKVIEQSKSEATALQNKIEYIIAKNIKTKTLARTGFMSFIRAYASYSSASKSIFHVKNLHLGHVAKSFGLQDAPKDIVKRLEKSVSHLPVKSSFEYRQAKMAPPTNTEDSDTIRKDEGPVQSSKDIKSPTNEKADDATWNAQRPRPSRKELMKRKMRMKPDLMSEFSSGLSSKRIKRA